jgi:hypothetical protein
MDCQPHVIRVDRRAGFRRNPLFRGIEQNFVGRLRLRKRNFDRRTPGATHSLFSLRGFGAENTVCALLCDRHPHQFSSIPEPSSATRPSPRADLFQIRCCSPRSRSIHPFGCLANEDQPVPGASPSCLNRTNVLPFAQPILFTHKTNIIDQESFAAQRARVAPQI